jgi:alpha-tubulin suppressor-like RCC1 family protein
VESLHPACFARCWNMRWFGNIQSAGKQSPLGRGLVLLAAAALLGAQTQLCRADSAVAWGGNFSGQLGDGTTTNRNTPVAVSGLSSGVTAVVAGGQHSLAVQNGGAYAWGSNNIGELGNGTITDSLTPVAVNGLTSGVTAVAANYDTSHVVQNGGVYSWGDDGNGRLGNGTMLTNSLTPVAVSGLTSGVTALAGGGYHTLALKNGGVFGWGYNGLGDLGDGTTTDRSTPVPVNGLSSGVTAIAAGGDHSFAVRNGGLYAWGSNSMGQLGDGTTTNRLTPVAVHGLTSGVTAVAGGGFHSLAVQNGGVYAWGYNLDGELGDGTTTDHLTPERIDAAELFSIVSVAAGAESSYALSSDGSLWVWGDNSLAGELGLGTGTFDYLTPQHLLPPSGYEFTSIEGSLTGSHAIATLAAVPEPSSGLLLMLGGLAAGLALHRRKSVNCQP